VVVLLVAGILVVVLLVVGLLVVGLLVVVLLVVGLLVLVLLRILAIHSLSLSSDLELVTLFLDTSFPVSMLLTSSTFGLNISESTNVGNIVLLVVVRSTATNTGNFFFLFTFFFLSVDLETWSEDGLGDFGSKDVDGVVVNSSGKGVKGLKLSCDKKLSTECFFLIFSSIASLAATVAETTSRNTACTLIVLALP